MDPLGAGAIITSQAREIESYNQYITPVLVRFASDINLSFGRNWTQLVPTNSTLSPRIYSSAPQALSPAIGSSVFNLRPLGGVYLCLQFISIERTNTAVDPPTAIPTHLLTSSL